MIPTDINSYILRVKSALRYESDDDQLTPAESEKCRLGLFYGVGPGDCAAQIIADRADLIRQTGEATCTN